MSSELVRELRARPYRLASENEDEMRERRQREREQAADTIERLEREKAEAFKAGMKRAAEIAKGRYAVTGTNVAAAILADAEKEVK